MSNQKKLKNRGKIKNKIACLLTIVSCREKMYLDQVLLLTQMGCTLCFYECMKTRLVYNEAIYLVMATRGKYISDIAGEINRSRCLIVIIG